MKLTLGQKMTIKRMRKRGRRPNGFKPGTVYARPSDGEKFVCFPDGSVRSVEKLLEKQKGQAEGAI